MSQLYNLFKKKRTSPKLEFGIMNASAKLGSTHQQISTYIQT
jgi:hypothetical protein